ncbi:hypothetical protein LCGC14_2400810 [marine sediment metagenome]|uniref:Uncharacterized protein n=1 Tax=marine sediment metagenome TaxID=412755 RepID=A0A0F9BVH2_9ZZZZ
MTKKDYIKLAKLIKEYNIGIDHSGFVSHLSQILKEDNPQFDRQRFIAACR